MSKSWDLQRIVEETGSTRYILPDDHGTLFTNRGGGACTWYLPPVADVQAGWWVEFYCLTDDDQTFAAVSTNLTVGNNVAATSIKFATTTEQIGQKIKFEFDGTTYLGMGSRIIGTTAWTVA